MCLFTRYCLCLISLLACSLEALTCSRAEIRWESRSWHHAAPPLLWHTHTRARTFDMCICLTCLSRHMRKNVCVCVRERERERERGYVLRCVCVPLCLRVPCGANTPPCLCFFDLFSPCSHLCVIMLIILNACLCLHCVAMCGCFFLGGRSWLSARNFAYCWQLRLE